MAEPKLFRCYVELSYMVLAESKEEAAKVAARAFGDEPAPYWRDFDVDYETTRMCWPGWERDSLVYGNHRGDITLEQAWDRMNIPPVRFPTPPATGASHE